MQAITKAIQRVSFNDIINKSLIKNIRRGYTPREIQWRSDKTGYYKDPNEIARRMIKLISLHDSVKNPNEITLNSTWHEIGLKDLDLVEVMLEAEREFYLEIDEVQLEKMNNVGEVVEYISRSFYAK